MPNMERFRALVASPWSKRAVVAVGLVACLVQWIKIWREPQGDFDLHWELSRRLIAGTFIYEGGHDYPYPPFWALAHAPLTVFSMHTANIVCYPLFIAAMATLLWTLNRITANHLPLSRDLAFWSTAAALFIAAKFLTRDMIECGVNLALVAATYLGIYLWTRRRDALGGICLGTAMALKCTPTLFLAYFVWKRQWKMAAASFATATVLTLSPALVMGPTKFTETFRFWLNGALVGVSSPDPSIGVLGPEPLQNMSLRPALARYLMHLPAGHLGRVDGPAYLDFLNLSPATAGAIIKGVLLVLAAYAAWRIRPRKDEPRESPGIVWECAAVSLLMLLVSPITWGQHCVGIVPALYLLCRQAAHDGRLPRSQRFVLAASVALFVVLNRELLGKSLSYLWESYHVSTAVLVALACTMLAYRPEPKIAMPQAGVARRAA